MSENLNNITNLISMLPPMIGYLLSYIGNQDIEYAKSEIAKATHIQASTITKFINKLIDNPVTIGWKYKGATVAFPPFILTTKQEKITGEIYTTKDFCYSDIFIPKRPSIPININFMVTTKCQTNCIYCYADRNRKDDLTTQDILRVIDEAYSIGVSNLTLSGGDIFAFPDWKKIIRKICQYRFSSVLSTKVPLNREDIFFLRDTGITNLQISLDSVSTNVLSETLQVNNIYIEKMKNMLNYCTEAGLSINVRTVLTKHNANKTEIDKLHILLDQTPCVTSWTLTPAFYSEFKRNYKEYRATDEDLIAVYKITQEKSISSHFRILHNKMDDKKNTLEAYPTVDSFIRNNQICNANSYSMSILSNGDAIACEMLYSNPYFIFGNVRNQSLLELWNSSVALKMYSYEQSMIKHKEKNHCVNCTAYSDCKLSVGKRVCYVDITKVYGKDKYEYPDPRCPHALPHKESLIL